ncbi:ImmA/IrrE family metallo-endopeptidase [Lysinibacillus cavernae]|uniref:ImmA/IrrE family metallo-endopeptidase n=1 Tax=Lysinibacillus cavernae TaxID=2666135 RepID=UPI0012D94FBE|nr:ImmA/IrrE family metallo-endopeptidase [Lysinibacillus cavernae]
MNYTTHTENFIKNLYSKMNISKSSQLQFQKIATLLNIQIFYWNKSSQALFDESHVYIFLNEQLTTEQLWQDFCHELGHVLLHNGQQERMPKSLIEYLENKANNFMYHACIPSFMLDEVDSDALTIENVQQLFNVEYDFAEKRLTQYFNKKMNMPNRNRTFL